MGIRANSFLLWGGVVVYKLQVNLFIDTVRNNNFWNLLGRVTIFLWSFDVRVQSRSPMPGSLAFYQVALPLSENCMYNLSDLEVETWNGCMTINTCIVGTRKSSRSPSIPSLPSVNHRQELQANPNLSYINFCPPNLWLIEESFSWVAGSINCHGRYYSLVLVAILCYAVT